jgi:SHS2 domain-containing protein
MSEENIEQARMALFDYFVDTLVDLSDPDDADRELAVDDMIQVTTILFEGLSLNVMSEEAGVLNIQVAM